MSASIADSGNFVLLSPRAKGDFDLLDLPDHPVYLLASQRRRGKLSQRRPRKGAPILEAVQQSGRSRLLLLPGSAGLIRRNGQPSLPLELLEIGDELRYRGRDYFVSRQRGKRRSLATSIETSARCPLCRVAFEPGQQIYRCTCGSILHCVDDQDVAEDERLECARMVASCPHCSESIEFGEGLAWRPEN